MSNHNSDGIVHGDATEKRRKPERRAVVVGLMVDHMVMHWLYG